MPADRSRKLPYVTNLDTTQYPLERVLPRIARVESAAQPAIMRAVTGSRVRASAAGKINNYLSALKSLGLLATDNRLTPFGRDLVPLASNPRTFKRALRQHILTKTNLGIMARVLQYTGPAYSGNDLVRECARTLEVAFDIEVPSRNQLFSYAFSFLRYLDLLDSHNVPRRSAVREAFGLNTDRYLDMLAHLRPSEATMLGELLPVADEGMIRVEDLKRRIRESTGEILEVGLGAAGLAKRLRKKGFVRVTGGRGHGARDTKVGLRNAVIRTFLSSPLAQRYLIRANAEAEGLLAHLDEIVATPMGDLLRRMRRYPNAGRLLELVAAKIAFKLGCRDITIRSRLTLPNVLAAGERDVLATLDRPLPYRMVIQCKAHNAPMGTAALYRELAASLLSPQIRTILFFSSGGYQDATVRMQRACLQAFPFLTIALFDEADLDALAEGEDAPKVVFARLREIAEYQQTLDDSLTPRQMRSVRKVLGEAKVPANLIHEVMNRLWPLE